MVSAKGELKYFPGANKPRKHPERRIAIPEGIIDWSAKTFFMNEESKLLVVRRSEKEDTRQFKFDIPGGKFEPHERGRLAPKEIAFREAEEELPGIAIRHLQTLHTDIPKRPDPEDGLLKKRYFFVGYAEFPDGVVELSEEHDSGMWVARNRLEPYDLTTKQTRALEVGSRIVDAMAELVQRPDLHEILPRLGGSVLQLAA